MIALVADIVRDHHQTRRAALLVLVVAFAAALVLAPALVIMTLYGNAGAVAVGALGALTTAGITARRAITSRRSGPSP